MSSSKPNTPETDILFPLVTGLPQAGRPVERVRRRRKKTLFVAGHVVDGECIRASQPARNPHCCCVFFCVRGCQDRGPDRGALIEHTQPVPSLGVANGFLSFSRSGRAGWVIARGRLYYFDYKTRLVDVAGAQSDPSFRIPKFAFWRIHGLFVPPLIISFIYKAPSTLAPLFLSHRHGFWSLRASSSSSLRLSSPHLSPGPHSCRLPLCWLSLSSLCKSETPGHQGPLHHQQRSERLHVRLFSSRLASSRLTAFQPCLRVPPQRPMDHDGHRRRLHPLDRHLEG